METRWDGMARPGSSARPDLADDDQELLDGGADRDGEGGQAALDRAREAFAVAEPLAADADEDADRHGAPHGLGDEQRVVDREGVRGARRDTGRTAGELVERHRDDLARLHPDDGIDDDDRLPHPDVEEIGDVELLAAAHLDPAPERPRPPRREERESAGEGER